jgi:hypothetical protein
MLRRIIVCILLVALNPSLPAGDLPFIQVSADKSGFVDAGANKPFVPWGFNYDHDEKGRLIEDYWVDEWPKFEADFAEMKQLGANVVRIHLQTGKFLDAAEKPNAAALKQLARLVKLAEKERLYLDLTGLGCYHKQDVPAWYDELDEQGRWRAQARFWTAVAEVCKDSPAIFCYDLMNEPVVPGGKRKDREWLGGAFGDKHFVQFITLDQNERPRHEIARQWIEQLTAAVREIDKRHLVTVGLVDWSLDRPGLTSGFVPAKVSDKLDFLCVHIYPEKGKVDKALATLEGFAEVGKPVVIEEMFPLKISPAELDAFVDESKKHADGWISFYWGQTIEELKSKEAKTFGEFLQRDWLLLFEKRAATLK